MNHDESDDVSDDVSDDELRRRLRAVDPAASLPPADPMRAARLVEDAMTEDHPTAAPARRRPAWALAAAAVAVIALGGTVVALAVGGGEEAPDVASPPATSAAPTSATDTPGSTPDADPPTVTRLITPQGPGSAGRCLPPYGNPEVIANQDVVFDGVVESVRGRTVTLVPSRFYAGPETDTVVVRGPGELTQALLLGVQFEEGERYLVSASGGQVTVCGFTDVYSPRLAAVYDEAFPG